MMRNIATMALLILATLAAWWLLQATYDERYGVAALWGAVMLLSGLAAVRVARGRWV